MLGGLMVSPPTPPKQPLPKSNKLTIMAQEKAWELYQQGLSMQQVANEMGKTKSNIQKLINGKKLRMEWEEYERKKQEYDEYVKKSQEHGHEKYTQKPNEQKNTTTIEKKPKDRITKDLTNENNKTNTKPINNSDEPELLKIKADTNIKQIPFNGVLEDINKYYTKVAIVPPQVENQNIASTINDDIEEEKTFKDKILENKNIILLSLVAVAIIGGGIYYFVVYKKRKKKMEEYEATKPTTTMPTAPEETDTSDVPSHLNAKWVVINGEKIPRGEDIL